MRLGAALLFAALSTGCTFARIVRHGPSDIDDYQVFESRPLPASSKPAHFVDRREPRPIPYRLRIKGLGRVGLDEFLEKTHTVAFLVVKGDALYYQRYFRGYTPASKIQIFSVSKSVQSLLVGAALRDGKLQGIEAPITRWIPELSPRGFDAVRMEDLLQMASGSSYVESDNPFGRHPALYYGEDMVPALLDLDLKEPPGTRFEYRSGDSELVGLALSRALAPETITDYARRSLWEPLGMEYEGSWAVDHPGGLEKTFCCLSLRAIDLAKIGAMMASGGRWRGQQIIPEDWVLRSTTPTTDRGGASFYRLGWWVPPELEGGFMGIGHLGQYLIVLPRSQLVIVRLGDFGSEGMKQALIQIALELERSLTKGKRLP
ncbi:MAG: serine hydrolase [Myxococcota bacterium]